MSDGPRELKDELDPPFHRKMWRVERVGWGLMLLIIVLTLIGAFGTSPLSTRHDRAVVAGATFEVDHPRFSRYELDDRLHVRVHAPEAQGDTLAIIFSNDFIENNMIVSGSPNLESSATADGGAYKLQVEDWSQPIVVTFEFEPRKGFWSPGEMRILAGESANATVPLAFFVYP